MDGLDCSRHLEAIDIGWNSFTISCIVGYCCVDDGYGLIVGGRQYFAGSGYGGFAAVGSCTASCRVLLPYQWCLRSRH